MEEIIKLRKRYIYLKNTFMGVFSVMLLILIINFLRDSIFFALFVGVLTVPIVYFLYLLFSKFFIKQLQSEFNLLTEDTFATPDEITSYEEEVIEFYLGKNNLGQIKIFPYVWFLSLIIFSFSTFAIGLWTSVALIITFIILFSYVIYPYIFLEKILADEWGQYFHSLSKAVNKKSAEKKKTAKLENELSGVIVDVIDEGEKLIKNLLNQKENIKTEIQELIVIAESEIDTLEEIATRHPEIQNFLNTRTDKVASLKLFKRIKKDHNLS